MPTTITMPTTTVTPVTREALITKLKANIRRQEKNPHHQYQERAREMLASIKNCRDGGFICEHGADGWGVGDLCEKPAIIRLGYDDYTDVLIQIQDPGADVGHYDRAADPLLGYALYWCGRHSPRRTLGTIAKER